jgi:hypothetical protein
MAKKPNRFTRAMVMCVQRINTSLGFGGSLVSSRSAKPSMVFVI